MGCQECNENAARMHIDGPVSVAPDTVVLFAGDHGLLPRQGRPKPRGCLIRHVGTKRHTDVCAVLASHKCKLTMRGPTAGQDRVEGSTARETPSVEEVSLGVSAGPWHMSTPKGARAA